MQSKTKKMIIVGLAIALSLTSIPVVGYYGNIQPGPVDGFEFHYSTTQLPTMMRIGTSQYFVTAYAGKSNQGWMNVTKVYSGNGTIQRAPVDSWEFDTTGQFPGITYISGNTYALVYHNATRDKVITFNISSADGTITKTAGGIDHVDLFQPGQYGGANWGEYNSFVRVGGSNIYAILQKNDSGNDGWMQTVYIAPNGQIGSTWNDTCHYNTTGMDWRSWGVSIDSDTIAMVWDTQASPYSGQLATYNISSSGAIQEPYSDQWRFASTVYSPSISKVNGNVFCVVYDGSSNLCIRTVTIANSGKITHSWIDTITYTPTLGASSQQFIVNNQSVYGATYTTGVSPNVGHVCTWNMTPDGTLDPTIADDETFNTTGDKYWAPVSWAGGNMYFIAYQGGNHGYFATMNISTQSGVPTTYLITPKNQSTGINRQPLCKIWANDTGGGSLSVNWYSSPDGSAFTHQQKNTTAASATNYVQWNYSIASGYATQYWFKTTIDDGTTNASFVYYFTTKAGNVPTTYVIAPKNQSAGINCKPLCRIWANDSGGGALYVNWYSSPDGSTFTHQQKNTTAASATNYVQWNYSIATGYGSTYWWETTIDDGATNASWTYYFIIKGSGTTLYVSTSGNDASGDGSIGTPYRTLPRALNASSVGGTVYLRGGNYNNIWSKTTGINIGRTNNVNGTVGSWFTISGYPGERAVIDGTGYTITAGYGLVHLSMNPHYVCYVRITNLFFQNCTSCDALVISSESNVHHHIRVDNCSFNYLDQHAIMVYGDHPTIAPINNISIEYCHCNYIARKTGYTGEGVSLRGARDLTIRNCSIGHCAKTCIDIANQSWNVRIFGNVVNCTTGSGMKMDGSQSLVVPAYDWNISIYNNKFQGSYYGLYIMPEYQGGDNNITVYNNIFNITNTTNTMSGIKLQAATAPYIGVLDNITIKHNTIMVTSSGYPISIEAKHERCKNIWIVNNILQSNGSMSNYQIDSSVVNWTDAPFHFLNNLYNNTAKAPNTWFKDGTGQFEATAVKASPQFVRRRGFNFHLNATSPAIDAGNKTYVVSFDFDGNARPQGSGYDIGAYEYLSSVQLSGFTVTGYTVSSGHKRHSLDNLNFSATITGASSVYINIYTARSQTINQSILNNHSAATNSYWCNRNFSNKVSHLLAGYGWPGVTCGNGTYQVYIFAKSGGISTKSVTLQFTIYPTADANMDNITNAVGDLSAIVGPNWGQMGANRLVKEDVNGDGIVNINDMTFIIASRNWGWNHTS